MAEVLSGPESATKMHQGNEAAPRRPSALERVSDLLNSGTEYVLALLIATTVVSVIAQVVFRYVVQTSLTWSEEVARYSFIWSIFLGTSVAAKRNQHIVVDALLKAAPLRLRRLLERVNALLMLSFFALFFYLSLILVQNALPQRSSALEISIAWVYASAVLGAALTVLHVLSAQLTPTHEDRP